MAKAVDLVGQRFGKLVVVERAENNHRGNTQWLCKCDCGKSKIALGYDLTLDRKNNDGIYEPSNCRWATLKQQANNKSTNVYITYQGKTQTLKQWSEELGLSYGMLKSRHQKGWGIDKLFLPKYK